MNASTTWKVEVGFYTGAINTRNVLTYQVLDTTNTDVVQNSVFGYANGGFQTAIQFINTAGTPSGTYCSFTDSFGVNPSAAAGGCSFVLTGGTADGLNWSGSANISIVLTRLS
jgi:ABC-type oligopeptide transport system substrate-binding subunit